MMDIESNEIEAVNLDGMFPDELMEFWEKNKDGTIEQRALATYAKSKAEAMMLRESGEINAALRLELNCDRIYGKLPQNLKW